MLPRSRLSVAPRFLWVGIELGRANCEGGGLPVLALSVARWVAHFHQGSRFPRPPYNAGRPDFPGPV